MGFIVVIMMAFFLAVHYKKRLIHYVPTALLMVGLISYCFAITIGTNYLIYAKSLIIFLITAWVIRGDDLINKSKEIFVIDDSFFFGFLFVVYLITRNTIVLDWDDLAHWGTVTKQIFVNNRVPFGSNSVSIFSDYPPFSACYFNFFLTDFSVYKENIIFPLWNLLLASCFIPFWEKIYRYEGRAHKVIWSVIIVLFNISCTTLALINLKVDLLVACLFLYAIICILEDDEKNSLEFFVACCCLAILKSVGVYFLVILILIRVIVLKRNALTKHGALGLLLTGAIYISWRIYCIIGLNNSYINDAYASLSVTDYLSTVIQLVKSIPLSCAIVLCWSVAVFFSLGSGGKSINHVLLAISMIMLVITSLYNRVELVNRFSNLEVCEDIEYTAFHYWVAFSTMACGYVAETNMNFGLSMLEILQVSMILSIIGFLLNDNRSLFSPYIKTMRIVVGATGVYICGHAAMYFYMFVGGEKIGLSAFSRYLSMFIAALIGIPVYYIMTNMTIQRNKMIFHEAICLCFVVLMLNIPLVYSLLMNTNDYYNDRRSLTIYYSQAADELMSIGFANDDYFIISNDDVDFTKNELRYALVPYKPVDSININALEYSEIVERIENSQAGTYILETSRLDESTVRTIDRILLNLGKECIGESDGFMIWQG